MNLFFILGTIALWEAGGQVEKAFRRFGIPTLILILCIDVVKDGGIWWHYLPLTLVMPELFLGYGTGSFVAKVFKEEWKIRLAYATLIWLPITITAWLNNATIGDMFGGFIFIVCAFQVHLGSFNLGKKYQFLWEDFFRAASVAYYITQAIIF